MKARVVGASSCSQANKFIDESYLDEEDADKIKEKGDNEQGGVGQDDEDELEDY